MDQGSFASRLGHQEEPNSEFADREVYIGDGQEKRGSVTADTKGRIQTLLPGTRARSVQYI
jgi:hypothetical protein